MAKQGDFQNIDADVIIRYYSTLKRIHLDHMPPHVALPCVCGIWVVGPPGVGKSHLAREWYPGLFNKNLNKWSLLDGTELKRLFGG